MNTVANLWNESELKNTPKTAVIEKKNRFTYGELGDRIRSISANLMDKWKVRPGDVVAILVPNSAEFVISYFAVVNMGAVVQPIDERLTPNEIKMVLSDSGARFLVAHHKLWPKYKDACRGRGQLKEKKVLGIEVNETGLERFADWLSCCSKVRKDVLLHPDDKAELMYTSGTTGGAKGVFRSHKNVRASSRNAMLGFGYRKKDIICIVMPLSHSSALVSQMMPLIELGGTIVLLERFDAETLIQTIQEEDVTCMRAVPPMLRMLLMESKFGSKDLPSLRMLINSSAAIDPETYFAVKNRFPKIELMNSYGLTEASTCTVLPDRMALERPDSIGTPIEGVEMSIRDQQGIDVENEREGEIWVRGDHVFVEYNNRQQETSATLDGDWLRTGDLGHRDSEGFYYFHGRKDDVINCGGHNFSPLEVENCILELPEVAEVAVVGTAYRMLDQVVKAHVLLKDGKPKNSKQIVRHCSRNLASYKVPLFVEFVTELPKNSTGKILRRKL